MGGPEVGRPQMPGYGVPDSLDGALPWTWALDVMDKTKDFFVSTTRPDGRPHSMPVWGLWSNDLFVFSTAITSVKSVNLKADPRIAVGGADGPRAIVIEGVARIVELDEVPDFVPAYKTKYDYTIDQGPVWAIEPTVAFGFVEDDSFAPTATRWKF